MKHKTTAYLGLGSNLGDRMHNLAAALELLPPGVTVEQISSVYETDPVGYLDQPPFLNAVCRVCTPLNANQLLHGAKKIEAKLGRVPGFRNAPRPIDIDILFYDAEVIDSPELTIPHPEVMKRAFVLVPLAEIAPDLVHPQNGKTITELLHGLGNITGVRKWCGGHQIATRRQDVSGIR